MWFLKWICIYFGPGFKPFAEFKIKLHDVLLLGHATNNKYVFQSEGQSLRSVCQNV